jgi:hypothetical protein
MDRDLINAALREKLVPSLRSRGFKGSLPHFRRFADGRIDLLTLQFDKWGGGFTIEIGRCSPEGIRTAWGKDIAPAKVTAHDLHPSARRRLGSPAPGEDGRWFRYDDGSAPSSVVAAAVALLDEADRWWDAV